MSKFIEVGTVLSQAQLETNHKDVYQNSYKAVPTGNIDPYTGTPMMKIELTGSGDGGSSSGGDYELPEDVVRMGRSVSGDSLSITVEEGYVDPPLSILANKAGAYTGLEVTYDDVLLLKNNVMPGDEETFALKNGNLIVRDSIETVFVKSLSMSAGSMWISEGEDINYRVLDERDISSNKELLSKIQDLESRLALLEK
jgi:hypothetical protein